MKLPKLKPGETFGFVERSTDPKEEPAFPKPLEIDDGQLTDAEIKNLPRFLRLFGRNPLFYE